GYGSYPTLGEVDDSPRNASGVERPTPALRSAPAPPTAWPQPTAPPLGEFVRRAPSPAEPSVALPAPNPTPAPVAVAPPRPQLLDPAEPLVPAPTPVAPHPTPDLVPTPNDGWLQPTPSPAPLAVRPGGDSLPGASSADAPPLSELRPSTIRDDANTLRAEPVGPSATLSLELAHEEVRDVAREQNLRLDQGIERLREREREQMAQEPERRPAYRFSGKTFSQWEEQLTYDLDANSRVAGIQAMIEFSRVGFADKAGELIYATALQYDWSPTQPSHSMVMIVPDIEQAFGVGGLPQSVQLALLERAVDSDDKNAHFFALRVIGHRLLANDGKAYQLWLKLAQSDDATLTLSALKSISRSEWLASNKTYIPIARFPDDVRAFLSQRLKNAQGNELLHLVQAFHADDPSVYLNGLLAKNDETSGWASDHIARYAREHSQKETAPTFARLAEQSLELARQSLAEGNADQLAKALGGIATFLTPKSRTHLPDEFVAELQRVVEQAIEKSDTIAVAAAARLYLARLKDVASESSRDKRLALMKDDPLLRLALNRMREYTDSDAESAKLREALVEQLHGLIENGTKAAPTEFEY
ncbi:MAG: hypothetical protein KDA61_15815, partial [Planctomycetales bacterium]|nr:hypothetical protein [Planctomycetales bacterium]